MSAGGLRSQQVCQTQSRKLQVPSDQELSTGQRAGAGSGLRRGSRGLYISDFWSGHMHLAFSLSMPMLMLFVPPKGFSSSA